MAWTSGALLVVLAQLVGAAGGPPADSSWPEERLSTLAFGSCSKPLYPQPLWDAINAARPQVWLWAGDAVYLGRDQPEGLREAYQAQLAHPGYRSLLNTVKHVDGVYDDHDLGENDAGKHFAHQKQSQAAFLDFLGVGTDAPSPRRERHGVYSSHVFGAPPHQTKVILLDTRTHRDDYLVWNVANAVPFGALVAAAVRGFTVALGVGRRYEGDVLGVEQWAWLEDQLRDSEAGVTIIVSSIQVLTSNPLVESWLHFPESQRRLLRLLLDTRPSHLLLLSGDVHHAEVAGRPALELTSSGMTHSCATSWWGALCPSILAAFPAHRARAGDVFTGYNFGTVEIAWGEERGARSGSPAVVRMVASARDVNGSKVLEAEVARDSSEALRYALRLMDELGAERSARGKMVLALASASICLLVSPALLRRLRRSN